MNIALVSDLQAGTQTAVWPNSVPLGEGGGYILNPVQVWLLKCWQHMTAEIQALRPDVLILDGDMIQGTSPKFDQLITTRTDVQVRGAMALLKPFTDAAKRTYFIKGTPLHDGACAEAIEGMAQMLGGQPCKQTGNMTWWDLNLDLGGIVANIAHSISTSRVPASQSAALLRDTLTIVSEVQRYNEKAPNVRIVVRAHRHIYCHVEVAPGIHGVVLPGWQLNNDYTFARGMAMMPNLGWVWLQWDGTDLLVRPRLYRLPKLHIEKTEVTVGNPNRGKLLAG